MSIDRDRVLAEVRVRPRSARELLDRLGGGRHAKRTLQRVLRELVRAGELTQRDRRYRLPRADGLVEGVFEPGPGDAGRVRTAAGRSYRVDSSGGAQAGERVLLLPLGAEAKADRSDRGEILDVLDARREEWIGIVNLDLSGAVVTPYRDDEEWGIPVSRKHLGRARDGDVVVLRPARRAPRGRVAGEVAEVLGRPGEPEPDFRAVVWHRRLPVAFPDDVQEEADAIVAPTGEALDDDSGVPYQDLRHLDFVTIDPASARDHDDAVWVEPGRAGGFRLFVAIADVARFVRPGSALDREALRRGNSVYFPDRAIPMLPDRLSGDLCSLRAGEDRLALVATLEVDADGALRSKRLARARIRSRAGLDYGQAAAALAGRGEALPDASLLAPLERLAACTRALRARRIQDGALDFDLPAAEITLDEAGMPVDVQRAARTEAHRAIEDAMLAANRAVAEWLLEAQVPGIFRIHEPPPADDAGALRRLLAGFGLVEARGRGALSPGELAQALRRVVGRPEELLVHRATLRAMQQARYSAENRGHFALAFDAYLHFTSPIRRYADLRVHRAVLARLADGEALARARAEAPGLAAVATRVSWRERVAMEAERDMEALKKCAFMARHLGESFPGTVTGVARHGLYVTLDPYFVEGLVHVSTLRDWVELDEERHVLVARDSGRRYGLGDRYRVLVEQVDPVKGWVNFAIEETLEEAPRVFP